MNQPHDAIRPRRRHRQPPTATHPAVVRAEQSTRILIRVPTVAVAEATSVMQRVGGEASAKHAEPSPAKEARKDAPVSTSGLRALLNETTPKRSSSSPPAGRSPAHGTRTSSTEIDTKRSAEAVPQPVETASQSSPAYSAHSSQYRLDAAHAEAGGPHTAAEAWQAKRGNFLTDLLQQRAMLAMALIVAGVIGAAIVLHSRTQHRALRSDGDPAANASRMTPKGNARSQEAASGVTGWPTNQGLAGNQGPVSAAANPAATDTRTANPATPSRWNAPAGANLPASVAPISIEQQTSTPSMPNMNQDPFYSAQRDMSQPSGGVDLGPRYSPASTAAFEGNINNTGVQFSR